MRQNLLKINKAGGDREFYWGILSKEEQQLINFELGSNRTSINELKNRNFVSGRFDYALDQRRVAAIEFLKDDKSKRVLEIGCGYGGITFALAKKFGSVVAIDATYELLEFTRLRLIGKKISNVELFHVSKFEDQFEVAIQGKFDLIVINGVLEWVGSGTNKISPKIHQQEFMSKCESLLSEKGEIFLAIENRWYPKWWIRDPHSKLPWTAILPRGFANLYSKRKRSESYRTWIYSRFALKKLLRKSNLVINKELFVLMTYRSPIWVESREEFLGGEVLVGPNLNSLFWKKLTSISLLRKFLFPLVIPSFVLLLQSQTSQHARVEE